MVKINIAEVLKGCPSGMELDCTMYDDVYFDWVDELNIIHCYIQHETHKTSITFNQYGTHCSDIKSKCVIFPKGKTTWDGFHQRPFKDGDILTTNIGSIFIFSHLELDRTSDRNMCKAYVGIQDTIPISLFHTEQSDIFGPYESMCRFATAEEKEKLFQAIKDNGYKWNPETNTLDKLPKFKVGDTITNGKTSITIGYIDNEYYYEISRNIANRLFIKFQDEWNLIDDKFPIKFNINTLVPFKSKVLIRDTKSQKWSPAIWGFYDSDQQDYPYKLIGVIARYCIPYEGNEHLLGKTDDCNEYFKTWKN